MTSEPELLGARRIRELLDKHRVMLTKSLGQNFVIDPNTIRKVVDVADVGERDHVLEIGAGAGSLTIELARRSQRVTAIELDQRLRPLLNETLGELRNVSLVFGDVLETDLAAIGASKVVANLPYNIAAQTVIKILQEVPTVETLCVMTQREVGERLAAGPGSKVYGLTSVLVAFHASARLAGTVSRSVFFPVPGVDSVLVRLDRRSRLPLDDLDAFVGVARAAFAQRRKNIRNALSATFPVVDVERALAAADIDPATRAEQLSVDEFAMLSRALHRT